MLAYFFVYTPQKTVKMGRNKFSQSEIEKISKLLKKKAAGTRFQQKEIRHILRTEFEFSISDFGEPGKAFGYDELQDCIKRHVIHILDDATIAAMKEKRARDKARDAAAAEQEALESGEATDWQQAMADWEAWEKSQKDTQKQQ